MLGLLFDIYEGKKGKRRTRFERVMEEFDTKAHEPHSIGYLLRFQQRLRHAEAGLQEGPYSRPDEDGVPVDGRG